MAWPRDAFVGQKVICILPPAYWFPPEARAFFRVGDVYTITDIEACGDGTGIVYFRVEGLRTGAFSHHGFRPVQKSNRSTETGMAILKRIACRKHQTIDAPEWEDV